MFLLLYYLLLCTEYQNVFNNAYKDNEEWYMNKVKKDLFF